MLVAAAFWLSVAGDAAVAGGGIRPVKTPPSGRTGYTVRVRRGVEVVSRVCAKAESRPLSSEDAADRNLGLIRKQGMLASWRLNEVRRAVVFSDRPESVQDRRGQRSGVSLQIAASVPVILRFELSQTALGKEEWSPARRRQRHSPIEWPVDAGDPREAVLWFPETTPGSERGEVVLTVLPNE